MEVLTMSNTTEAATAKSWPPKLPGDVRESEAGMARYIADLDLNAIVTAAAGFREEIVSAAQAARETFGGLRNEAYHQQAEEVEQHLARALLVLTMAEEEEVGYRRRDIARRGEEASDA
jgi:hypothetical protein